MQLPFPVVPRARPARRRQRVNYVRTLDQIDRLSPEDCRRLQPIVDKHAFRAND